MPHGGKASSSSLTKSALYEEIAKRTGLKKSEIGAVFDEFQAVAIAELKRGNSVTIPGVAKIKVHKKPATKATSRPNPFKPGEMMTVKAKPARTSAKIRPIKQFKDAL